MDGDQQGVFTVLPAFRADADNAGDVLVIVRDVDFYVHRDLLWFASTFFRDLLCENWAEAHFDESDDGLPHDGIQASKGEQGLSISEAPGSASATVTRVPASTPSPPPADVAVEESTDETREAQGQAGKPKHASYHTANFTLDESSPIEDSALEAAQTSSAPMITPSVLLSPSSRSDSLPSRSDRDPAPAVSPTLSLQDLQLLETPPGSPRQSRLASLSRISQGGGGSGVGVGQGVGASPSGGSSSSPSRERVGGGGGGNNGRVFATPSSASNAPAPTSKHRHRPISKPRGIIVSVLRLEEEQPATFQAFLRAVYPHLRLAVSWRNIGNLLSFSDKYGVPPTLLYDPCLAFLDASLTGNPIEAMRLAETFSLEGVYREASKHVLDLYSAWSPHELAVLSKETLIKLERKRSWFLERLLKFSVANLKREYECHAGCPQPRACAEALQVRWSNAYGAAFRFGPPQPTVVWRHLRELEGGGPPLMHSACEAACRTWVQTRFDRMFELGLASPRARAHFLHIVLDDAAYAKKVNRRRVRADQLPASASAAVAAAATHPVG